jgi:hypothetical protein
MFRMLGIPEEDTAVLITHHDFSLKTISKDEIKEITSTL